MEYGDTLFDDPILPGYVSFLESLVKARKMTQDSFQENQYSQQNDAEILGNITVTSERLNQIQQILYYKIESSFFRYD